MLALVMIRPRLQPAPALGACLGYGVRGLRCLPALGANAPSKKEPY
jgi:hypothetical protein